jgi:general secretion pathway protein A
MYEKFYRLRNNPFALTPDPSFMIMTQGHCDAKAGLMYAILSGKGFTVLTGEAGTGKTTLLRSVINSIPPEKLCSSFVVNPALTPDDFSDMAVCDFGLGGGMGKPDRLRKFHEFLLESRAAGKVSVLFVDEAHRLSIETLEEIRLMTNFETENQKLLQIVLVGQDELDELLDRRELRQLKQRVEVHLHIGPLSTEEVRLYINHRWSCASDAIPPFSTGAIHQIGRLSHGIPRLISSICDNALLLGFAESTSIVTEEHILEVSRDLRLIGTLDRRPIQRIEDRPSPRMELQIPQPALSVPSPPLPLNGNDKPARSWWPRFSGVQKA